TRWPRDWSSDVCSSDLRQTESLNEIRIVPPAPRGTHVQRAATRTSGAAWTTTARNAGALVRRTVRTARGGLLSKTGRSEQECDRSEERRVGREWGCERE